MISLKCHQTKFHRWTKKVSEVHPSFTVPIQSRRVEDVSADVPFPDENPWLVASANSDLPPVGSTALGSEYEDPFALVSAGSDLPYDDLVSADSGLPYPELVSADSGLSTENSLFGAESDPETWDLPSDGSLFDGGIASNSPIDLWPQMPTTEPEYLARGGTCNNGEIPACGNGYGYPDQINHDEISPAHCRFSFALNTVRSFIEFDN